MRAGAPHRGSGIKAVGIASRRVRNMGAALGGRLPLRPEGDRKGRAQLENHIKTMP